MNATEELAQKVTARRISIDGEVLVKGDTFRIDGGPLLMLKVQAPSDVSDEVQIIGSEWVEKTWTVVDDKRYLKGGGYWEDTIMNIKEPANRKFTRDTL